jgi:GTP-binding protein Era
MSTETLRSGFVTLVGRPNSGKSTLLNQLVGEKVSIVTDKPQTTRNVVRGIVTRPEGQIVFLDTPGIHKPIHKMNALMMDAVRESMSEVDVIALLVDCSERFGRGDQFTVDLIKPMKVPKILLLNKTDKVKKQDLLPLIDQYSKLDSYTEILPISALKRDNVDSLLSILFKLVPQGPFYYPEDQLSDRHERSLVSEIVREKVIEFTREELPYSVAVNIDRFEEGPKLHRIYATIHVDRETQKGIVIGKGGLLLKEIGIAARADIEKLLSQPVYLELRVKVSPGWRDDDQALRSFGLGPGE